MVTKLSVVVITRNEERQIRSCLRSLAGLADELMVIDSLSEDSTIAIAREMGATVFEQPFVDFARQRNRALELARGEWVFFVDADERCSPPLAREIRQIIDEIAENAAGEEPTCGYWVPRRNYFFGRQVKHAGWFPDYQLRLFQRQKGRYDDSRPVHELVVLQGNVSHLANPLIHYNYEKPGQFLVKQRAYSRLEAANLYNQGARPKPWTFLLQPLREFKRRYISLEGYKDGWLGLLLSLLLAWYNFVSYVHLARLSWRKGLGTE